MPSLTAPSNWHIEIWDKGATTLIDTLTSPEWVAPIVEKLNGVGTFSFRLGMYDTQAPHCNPRLGREVRVFRGASWAAATYKWAGRIWTDGPNFDSETVTFNCFSLWDYLRDRFIDRGAQRTDLLLNSDFETGLTNWAATACTATVITSDHVSGTKAVQLVQGTDDADAFLAQDITYTAGSEGDLITVVAWFKVVSWTGPALANWGLTVENHDGSGNVYDFNSFTIDYQTPRGKWLKAQATTWVPPGATRTVRARLMSINGTIEWDAAFGALMESLSNLATEQATIAASVITFLQDSTKGKDDLGISTSVTATGVNRDRTWQFADHISGEAAEAELQSLADGMDMEITPDRVFHTYAISSGGIGTDKTGTVTLTFGDAGNFLPTRRPFDGPTGASDVTALGDGGGPGREEGGARNGALFGGCTVQQILPPPSPDTPIDILGPYATRHLANVSDPTIIEGEVTDRELGFTLKVGDRVTLSANMGYVQESGHGRIMQRSINPYDDVALLTLNHVA